MDIFDFYNRGIKIVRTLSKVNHTFDQTIGFLLVRAMYRWYEEV